MLMTVFTRSHTYNHHFMCTTLNSQKAGYQEEFTLLNPSGPATPVRHMASPFSAHPMALCPQHTPQYKPGSMPPNPLNDDTPTMTHDEPDTNSLAKAINNLISPICRHLGQNSANPNHSMALTHANSGHSSSSAN